MSDEQCRIVEMPGVIPKYFSELMLPGDLLVSPYEHEALKDLCLFKCPVCKETWSLRIGTHQIVQREPLTIMPSWLCPKGCHFWVRDGKVIPA